jgi:DNA-binding transcriptional MerR regulator
MVRCIGKRMNMQTIGELAKTVGLSRSTLLYYDRLGLLSPSGHLKGEYRLYSPKDATRLKKICQYRKAGLSLKAISRLIDKCGKSEMNTILETRLLELNNELQQVKEQQAFITALLGRDDLIRKVGNLTKDSWTDLLSATGFSEQDMWNWHIRFERSDPEKHEQFLTQLQIPRPEIALIRNRAARGV